jgi:hypothetical protein
MFKEEWERNGINKRMMGDNWSLEQNVLATL